MNPKDSVQAVFMWENLWKSGENADF